jgi:hypothetical protein
MKIYPFRAATCKIKASQQVHPFFGKRISTCDLSFFSSRCHSDVKEAEIVRLSFRTRESPGYRKRSS